MCMEMNPWRNQNKPTGGCNQLLGGDSISYSRTDSRTVDTALTDSEYIKYFLRTEKIMIVPFSEEPLSAETCQDNNNSCDYWAGIGECNNNPGYMLQFC